MKTKILALDVYGTILPTKGKNVKRKGLESFLSNCKSKGLIICACSDGKTQHVKNDLSEAKIDLRYFDKYFQMPRKSGDFTKQPKEFGPILSYYNLYPGELTVIGDKKERDTEPARILGCNAILVPEYRTPNEKDYFDMNEIEVP